MKGFAPNDGDRVQLSYTSTAGKTVEHIGEVQKGNVIKTDSSRLFHIDSTGKVVILNLGSDNFKTKKTVGHDATVKVVDV